MCSSWRMKEISFLAVFLKVFTEAFILLFVGQKAIIVQSKRFLVNPKPFSSSRHRQLLMGHLWSKGKKKSTVSY